MFFLLPSWNMHINVQIQSNQDSFKLCFLSVANFLIYNSKLQLVKSIMISKDLQKFYELTEIRFTKS